MEKAVAVMKQSINEPRADKKASPLVGAVLVMPDGTVDTAFRGELRHPKLQFAFGGTKLLEGRGLGMRTLGAAAAKYGLPVPKYAFDGVYLNLTIYRHARAALGALGAAILDKLSKSERSGWEWLSLRNHVTSAGYAEAMGLPYRTAMNHLRRFQKLGLLDKTGAARATEYRARKL